MLELVKADRNNRNCHISYKERHLEEDHLVIKLID